MLFLLALTALAAATLSSALFYQKALAQQTSSLKDGKALKALPPADQSLRDGRQNDKNGKNDKNTDKNTDKNAAAFPLERGIDALLLGDVISDAGDDWIVVDVTVFREEKEQWRSYRLNDGKRTIWMEVRSKGQGSSKESQAHWLQPVDDGPLFGNVGNGFTYRSIPFQLERRGDAVVVSDADDPGREASVVRYARYTGIGNALFMIEEEGPARRAFLGRPAVVGTFLLIPGQGLRGDDVLRARS